MFPGERLFKQTLIAVIAVVVLSGSLYGVTVILIQSTPTPTPVPQAQPKPIEVLGTYVLPVQENDYDVLLRVQNPNPKHGSGMVKYELTFFNEQSTPVGTYDDTFYILPGQTKYVLVTPLHFTQAIATASLHIKEVTWQELDELSNRGVNFVASSQEFRRNPAPAVTGKVTGAVFNNSDFDVTRIDVVVVLFNTEDKPIGANHSEINTFIARTTRGFEVSWFTPIQEGTVRTYAEASTNLFENSTFIRMYGNYEPFQSYYKEGR